MKNHDFPTDETLAEFIDGRLDAESRQRVVEHLATCSECYDMFLTATEFAAISPEDAARSAGGEVVRGKFGRGARYAAAAMVAVVAVGLVALRGTIGEWSFGRRTGMASLVEVTRGVARRPVEARFSGGFEYKPAKRIFRSSEQPDEDHIQTLLLQEQTAQLETQAQTSKAKAYGAAVGKVLIGKPDEGAPQLEAILLASSPKGTIGDAIARSDDKRLLNDLAAAWIARSERSGDQRAQDLERAVAAAERALQLDPRFVEAAYNRALALDHLDLHKRAIEAWEAYLTIETDPRWREEVQGKINTAREDLKYEESPQSQSR